MKELSPLEAERLVGRRLDRRRRYATTEDGKPDEFTGAVLFSLLQFTRSCTGCHETIDGHSVWPETRDKNGIVLGGGCQECGYQGKVRSRCWVPHFAQGGRG